MAGIKKLLMKAPTNSQFAEKAKIDVLGTSHRDDAYSAARCTRCRPGDAVMPLSSLGTRIRL